MTEEFETTAEIDGSIDSIVDYIERVELTASLKSQARYDGLVIQIEDKLIFSEVGTPGPASFEVYTAEVTKDKEGNATTAPFVRSFATLKMAVAFCLGRFDEVSTQEPPAGKEVV